MPNLLKTGAQWLHRTLSERAAEDIQYYWSHSPTPVPMRATIGASQFSQESDETIVHAWEGDDFVILASYFTRNGSFCEPCKGDTIRRTSEGTVRDYELLSPGNEPIWRWSDPHHTALRIHTKMQTPE